MTDNTLQDLLETWIRDEITSNGGELSNLEVEVIDGNVCIHFEADQNPFEASPFNDDKTCIYEESVSLRHRDGKERYLIKGIKILEDYGAKVAWLTSMEDYGSYTDIADEHTMSAWISYPDKFESALTERNKAYEGQLISEIEEELQRVVDMTAHLKAPLDDETKSYVSNKIKNIARNTLCL